MFKYWSKLNQIYIYTKNISIFTDIFQFIWNIKGRLKKKIYLLLCNRTDLLFISLCIFVDTLHTSD